MYIVPIGSVLDYQIYGIIFRLFLIVWSGFLVVGRTGLSFNYLQNGRGVIP
jgi:hypothetical protein